MKKLLAILLLSASTAFAQTPLNEDEAAWRMVGFYEGCLMGAVDRVPVDKNSDGAKIALSIQNDCIDGALVILQASGMVITNRAAIINNINTVSQTIMNAAALRLLTRIEEAKAKTGV